MVRTTEKTTVGGSHENSRPLNKDELIQQIAIADMRQRIARGGQPSAYRPRNAVDTAIMQGRSLVNQRSLYEPIVDTAYVNLEQADEMAFDVARGGKRRVLTPEKSKLDAWLDEPGFARALLRRLRDETHFWIGEIQGK